MFIGYVFSLLLAALGLAQFDLVGGASSAAPGAETARFGAKDDGTPPPPPCFARCG